MTFIALAWMLGCGLGSTAVIATLWLGLALLGLAAMVVLAITRRTRAWEAAALLTIVLLAAGWSAMSWQWIPADHLARYVTAERQLVQLVGIIDSPPRVTRPARGAMAAFAYGELSSVFELQVQAISSREGDLPVQGRVLVREPQRQTQLRQGQRVRILGLLQAALPPANPGEHDFRPWMADRGLAGFFTMAEPNGWLPVEADEAHNPLLLTLQAKVGSAAVTALSQGLERAPHDLAFLQTLLLGRRGVGLDATETAFRRVGLAHILSISGAHLGILVSLVVLVLLMAGCRPLTMAVVVMGVLGLYLLAVPPQVPVLRAAIMAGMLVMGHALGRQVARLDPLALACVVVLIWRPQELFSPGFQLSFGVVGGLLSFTAPLAQRLAPQPALPGLPMSLTHQLWRYFSAYLAANLVAFVIAAPLVAYHFQNVSPLTVPLSIITLPLITLVLGLGYFKIAVGMLLPGLGSDLSLPLWWVTHALVALVDVTSRWRLSYLELAAQPSVGWTIAAVGVGVALLMGWYRSKRWALGLSLIILAGWFMLLQMGIRLQPSSWPTRLPADVALRVNFLSVGDGNCYILRARDEAGVLHTMLYDCGARHVDGGLTTIWPALRELGVRRIDTLVISHADMDHFNGTLDVVWRLPVGRVVISPQMSRQIENETAASAPAFLLARLREMELPVDTLHAGQSFLLGDVRVNVLWPTPEFVTPVDNDNDLSLVLAMEAGGKRLLLSGDIARLAMQGIVETQKNVQSDVTDMPHHGSFDQGNSLRWLQLVNPQIVVQSAGRNRLVNDPWRGQLSGEVMRLVTAQKGMVEIDFGRDGRIATRWFMSQPGEDAKGAGRLPGQERVQQE